MSKQIRKPGRVAWNPVGNPRQQVSRRRAIGLAVAAGGMLAFPGAPGKALAAWDRSLPSSLRGTVTFDAFLYEAGATNVANGKQPGIQYAKYLKAHPGVKLEFLPEPSGSESWNAWFLPRAITKRAPDILQPGVSCWPFIQRGFIVPITKWVMAPNPYIAGNKRWIDSVPPGFLNPFIGLDGEYYGFGADTAAIWVYYNPHHLAAIGVKPPATWAELMAACAKLQAKGITPFSMSGLTTFLLSWWFLFAEGSLWASEFPPNTSLDVRSWVKAVRKGLLKKTDARTRQAWQLVKDFSRYWAKGTLSVQQASPQLYKDFSDGKFTFLLDGSFEISTLTPLVQGKFPLSVLPIGIPPITKETNAFANGSLQANGSPALNGIDLWVTRHAEDHLDLVMDFLQYIMSPQVMGPMALEVGEVPVGVGVGVLPPLIEHARQVVAQPGLLTTPYFSADPAFTDKYDQMTLGYLSGAISLDTALQTLESLQQSVAARLASHIR